MSFDWKDFHSLSKILKDGPGAFEEASYRTAVSRAYYYIYHFVTKYAIDKFNYNVPQYNQHKQLNEFLNTKCSSQGTRTARHLGQLLGWRKQCDYDNEVENLKEHILKSSENAVIQIENIIQSAENANGSSN